MKSLYFISFLLLVFISCGKGIFGDARVDGIVKDKTTESPIAGATVYLLESENDYCLFCPTSSYIIDSTTTNNKGEFEFWYDNKNGYTYSVNAVKNCYIDNQIQTYINDLGSGIDVEVFLDPEAFLKVRVHNVNVDATHFQQKVLNCNFIVSNFNYQSPNIVNPKTKPLYIQLLRYRNIFIAVDGFFKHQTIIIGIK